MRADGDWPPGGGHCGGKQPVPATLRRHIVLSVTTCTKPDGHERHCESFGSRAAPNCTRSCPQPENAGPNGTRSGAGGGRRLRWATSKLSLRLSSSRTCALRSAWWGRGPAICAFWEEGMLHVSRTQAVNYRLAVNNLSRRLAAGCYVTAAY